MRPFRPRGNPRQLALFVSALALPCAVLVVLALRLMSQDRELAEKRALDQRRDSARALARIIRDAADSIAAGEQGALESGRLKHTSTVLATLTRDGRLALPWRLDPAARDFARSMRHAPFADAVRQGEHAELVEQRFDKALALYARARLAAPSSQGAAWADWLSARTSHAAGARSLEQVFLPPARITAMYRDDEGVPFALYALARLTPLEQRGAAVAAFQQLSDALERSAYLSPAACHMAVGIRESSLSRARCRELDRLEVLARSFALSGPGWRVVAGDDPWLIGARDSVAVILRLSSLAAVSTGEGRAVMARDTAGAVPLPSLQGLWLAPGAGTPGVPARGFYLLFVVFAVSAAVFGAYLLWRDIRREVATAELRSQFVSGVTHELKTPLTAIRMFAETLRERDELPPAMRAEYLDTMIGETARLTRLLNNVLDFSRIERGDRKYDLRPGDVRACVDAALRAMRHPLAQQGFTIFVQDDGASMRVRCDADAIEQAVLNLLSNAVKYSGDCRDLRVALSAPDGDAIVAVTDGGVGIAGNEQDRIFDKFYRARTPINESVTGTGLGLTLVRHIMQGHGGRVDVKSTLGRGSTFTLRIPLAAAAAPALPVSLETVQPA